MGVVPNPAEKPRKTTRVAQAGAKKNKAKSFAGTLDQMASPRLTTNKETDRPKRAMMTFMPTARTRRASLRRGSQAYNPVEGLPSQRWSWPKTLLKRRGAVMK